MSNVSVSDEFCFSNMSDAITISSWYVAQMVFLFVFFGIFIVLLVLVELNYVHVKMLRWYQEGTQIFSLVFVLIALARNLNEFVNSAAIPLCGLESYASCTALTSGLSNIFFRIYAAANYTFAVIFTIVTEVGRRKAAELINYRPVPMGLTGAYVLSILKKLATIVMEKIIVLITAIFSPGMVLLEVMPFNDICIQDQNLKVVLYHAITHGSVFVACCVAPVLDLLSDERNGKLTMIAVSVFVGSGIVMFFIQIFASAGQPVMWSLWSFSVAYPSLIALSQYVAILSENLCEAVFALHSGSNFVKKVPEWSLAERILSWKRKQLETGIESLESSLHALAGVLDRFYEPLDIKEILQRVYNEEAQKNLRLPQESGDGVEAVPPPASGNAAADADHLHNPAVHERQGRLAVLALTTLLPPSRWYHKILRPVQLFDRLHDVLETALAKDEKTWCEEYEKKLAPLLCLISSGLQQLPTNAPHVGWLANESGESYFLMRRLLQSDVSVAWFEDHVGPATDDVLSPRGALQFPVVFRSFVWGFTDRTKLLVLSGKNDALFTVRAAPEVHFEFEYTSPHSEQSGGQSVVPRGIAGQCRYLGTAASTSWYDANRGDVLYCPGAAFAVESVEPDLSPLQVVLSDMVAQQATTITALTADNKGTALDLSHALSSDFQNSIKRLSNTFTH